MRPNITISIPDPYITLEAYCEKYGVPISTARDMIADGRLPVRGRVTSPLKRSKVFVNMAALTIEALSSCNISLEVK